ncbi:MAG: PIN domain-containing protein [Gloeobacterales cyanobacterium]
MSLKKTYIDSGVLINAFRGTTEVSLKATQILDDPTREFASSPFVKLEALPKAIYNKQQEEAEFYEVFFAAITHWASDLEQICKIAEHIARTYGLAGMDALHVAAALSIRVDELVTTERTTKPMHRVTEVQIISIAI